MQGDSERLGVYKGVLWGFKGLLGTCQQGKITMKWLLLALVCLHLSEGLLR